jgi:hypothetical protein
MFVTESIELANASLRCATLTCAVVLSTGFAQYSHCAITLKLVIVHFLVHVYHLLLSVFNP